MEERQKSQQVRSTDGTTTPLKVSPTGDARQKRAEALAKKRAAESKPTQNKLESGKA